MRDSASSRISGVLALVAALVTSFYLTSVLFGITVESIRPTGVGSFLSVDFLVMVIRTATANQAVFVTFVLWQLILLYTIPTAFWLYEVAMYLWYAKLRGGRSPDSKHWGPDEVQLRILTIDNAAVVQNTVDSLPESFDDILVVAEADISIDGAEVVVVPESFTCNAQNKGRAVEYARRVRSTDREYILYIDEDTIIPEFEGIPSDADIVQFRERPLRTGSLITYLAEIHRIGFNFEQRAFPFLTVPFYAWGGGIAICRSLEDRVTWDIGTIVEDSVFVWRAILENDASFALVKPHFNNQAPPTVRSMITQRRRWLTGTRSRSAMLPWNYRVVYHFRDLGWALSMISSFIWGLSILAQFGIIPVPLTVVFFPDVYTVLSMILLGLVYSWSLIGLVIYRERWWIGLLLLITTPLIVTIHSVGALYGLLRPARDFAVTTKVVVERTLPDPISEFDATEDTPVVSDIFEYVTDETLEERPESENK